MKKLALILAGSLVLFLGLNFTGCTILSDEDSIIGTWETYDGNSKIEFTETEITISYSSTNSSGTANYYLDDNKLYVYDESGSFFWYYQMNDNLLTLSSDENLEENITIYYKQ